jgi:hypothetical protein
VAHELHGSIDAAVQFVLTLCSAFAPAMEGSSWSSCRPCATLVLLVATHLFVGTLILYSYYLTDWRMRLLFLRTFEHPLLTPEAVHSAGNTLGTVLLVDCSAGRHLALLAHSAAVVSMVLASWSVANCVVLDVLPLLLPAVKLEQLCPLAPSSMLLPP